MFNIFTVLKDGRTRYYDRTYVRSTFFFHSVDEKLVSLSGIANLLCFCPRLSGKSY